jgi:hypothetical protein
MLALLLLLLFLRSTRGLDLGDEMQYYGQILGLVESGRLFTNDLFIQQLIYVPLAPLFALHHALLGSDGLVIFGRIVLGALTVAMCLHVVRKLVAAGIPLFPAQLTALALAFAAPYHGIFAPSYNTVSQLLWICFSVDFIGWRRGGEVGHLALITVLMAFAHPPLAVTMTLLILCRSVLTGEARRALRFLGFLTIGGLGSMAVLSALVTPSNVLAALRFSQGFGVGNAGATGIMIVAGALMAAALPIGRRISQAGHPWPLAVAAITAAGLVGTSVLFVSGILAVWWERPAAAALAAITALAGMQAAGAANGTQERRSVEWLFAIMLSHAVTLVFASANGLSQSVGAWMIGLPLLLGVAARGSARPALAGATHGVVVQWLAVALLAMWWCSFPYREEPWWRATATYPSIPAFRHIKSSPERTEFLASLQTALLDEARGRRIVVAGEYPAVYFSLEAEAATCVFFMHSLTSDKSESELRACMEHRDPEIIIDIIDIERSEIPSIARMRSFIRQYAADRGMACEGKVLRLHLKAAHVPANPELVICRQASRK